MISSVFILNQNGEVIIEKHYRGNTRRGECDLFWAEVLKVTNPEDLSPIITTSSGVLLHVHRSNLFFVASVKRDVMPMVVVEFLQRVADLLLDYFSELNEHAIKDNFITVYELLDEMLDNGLPLNMEPNMLKLLIPPPDALSKMIVSVTGGDSAATPNLPRGTLSNVYWRKRDVSYLQHEVFVDVVETIDGIISKSGNAIEMSILGTVHCNCKISGMPDITLVLNEAANSIEDVALHPCVRWLHYEKTGDLSFVPPDGDFKLLTYVIRKEYPLPIKVSSSMKFQEGQTTGEMKITVSPDYPPMRGSDGGIEECVITVNLPEEAMVSNVSCNMGSPVFDEMTKIWKWSVGKVPRHRTATFFGKLFVPPGQPVPKRSPPVLVQFNYWAHGAKPGST